MSDEKKIDDGGAAFPGSVAISATNDGCTLDASSRTFKCEGMSLRDYFAGQALQGMLANSDWYGKIMDTIDRMNTDETPAHLTMHHDMVASQAYEQADAMLTARRERGQQ